MRIYEYMGSWAGMNGFADWSGALKCKDYKIRDMKAWGRGMVGLGRGFSSA